MLTLMRLGWILSVQLLVIAAEPEATYKCTVCQHVYDAQKDGGGLPFEQLPATWKCPVCGSPKSAFKPTAAIVSKPEATYKCTVCQHVYDAQKDGGGLPFEQLPATWKCPVCGSPKSAFKPTAAIVSKPEATYKCTVCQHVYDAQKDGGGLPFEQLPATWKCPVCGSPKSAFKPAAALVTKPEATYKCTVCQHVYDAQKDGGGLPFEQLPATWKCPVCGSPKSAFKATAAIVSEPEATYKCTVCQHVYDAQKDGGGLPFEQLPATWKCPVCGSPKSAFKPTAAIVSKPESTYKCTVCQHVYDAQKDGGGLPFEQLPATWKCPVCGSPKSAFKPTASIVSKPEATYTCTVCQHVYDAQKDGGGLPFDQLPATWKCPVCGSPKSAFKKSAELLVV